MSFAESVRPLWLEGPSDELGHLLPLVRAKEMVHTGTKDDIVLPVPLLGNRTTTERHTARSRTGIGPLGMTNRFPVNIDTQGIDVEMP